MDRDENVKSLWKALEEVEDPELPVSVVDLGLIYGLERNGRHVDVRLTFTAMGCPCADFILEDVRKRLLEEPGVDSVKIEVVWDPPWTSERLSPRAVAELKERGVVR